MAKVIHIRHSTRGVRGTEGGLIDGPKHYFSEPFATQIKRAMVAADEIRKARAAGKPAPVQEYLPNKPMSAGQRADFDGWPFPPTNYKADDLTYVIRIGTANPEIWLDAETPEQEAPARRSYKIQRELF